MWSFIQNEILGMRWLERFFSWLLSICGLDVKSKLGGSVLFFLYDTVKIMLLLGFLILIISYIQSFFPPERSKKLLRQCLEPGGPYVYEEAVQADTEFFSALEDSSSWEEMRELCSAHTWQSLPGKRDAGIDPDLREACKKERSAIKDQFTKQIEKPFFTFDTERITGWLRTACRQGRELVRLTLAYWLSKSYGLRGVWIAMAVELTFRGILFLARLWKGNWNKRLRS